MFQLAAAPVYFKSLSGKRLILQHLQVCVNPPSEHGAHQKLITRFNHSSSMEKTSFTPLM